MLSLLCCTSAVAAYMAPTLPNRPVVASRAGATPMALERKMISFDQDGVFEGREVAVPKPPMRILTRLEELQVLTSVSDAGLLSAAEEAGVFSKLESAGAFSTIEGLLPTLDKLKLLSTSEELLQVDAWKLSGLGAALIIGELTLISFVPDDSALLVGVQGVTALAAGAAAVTLFALSFLFSLLQDEA